MLLANGFVTWAPCDVNVVHFVHSAWVRSAYHPWRLKRDVRSLYAKSYNSLNAALEKIALRRSARIVAVSDSVRHDLIRIGVPQIGSTSLRMVSMWRNFFRVRRSETASNYRRGCRSRCSPAIYERRVRTSILYCARCRWSLVCIWRSQDITAARPTQISRNRFR